MYGLLAALRAEFVELEFILLLFTPREIIITTLAFRTCQGDDESLCHDILF